MFVCVFKFAHLVAIAPSFTVRIASTQHVVTLIESKQEGVQHVAKRGFNLRHAITHLLSIPCNNNVIIPNNVFA